MLENPNGMIRLRKGYCQDTQKQVIDLINGKVIEARHIDIIENNVRWIGFKDKERNNSIKNEGDEKLDLSSEPDPTKAKVKQIKTKMKQMKTKMKQMKTKVERLKTEVNRIKSARVEQDSQTVDITMTILSHTIYM